MAVPALKPKNAMESLRDLVQDLLVPELKALKAELESQRRENQTQFEGIRTEFKITADALSADTESLRVEMRPRNDRQTQALQAVSDKIGTLMEVRKRLAVLDDRAKRA